MTPNEFEQLAGSVLSHHYGADLRKRKLSEHPKAFDFVSEDGQIVGDAKYYTLVRGEQIPPAKWATISEHVWFLEKVHAREKFLVFGNDIRVARGWLGRWGRFLEQNVLFYFLEEDGRLKRLSTGE